MKPKSLCRQERQLGEERGSIGNSRAADQAKLLASESQRTNGWLVQQQFTSHCALTFSSASRRIECRPKEKGEGSKEGEFQLLQILILCSSFAATSIRLGDLVFFHPMCIQRTRPTSTRTTRTTTTTIIVPLVRVYLCIQNRSCESRTGCWLCSPGCSLLAAPVSSNHTIIDGPEVSRGLSLS
jgi:hypothetical protein